MTREQAVAYALEDEAPPAESSTEAKPSPDEPLTARELQVLRLMADGLSNGEIADRLFLARSTIKWYARQIFTKLEASNRMQAVTQGRTRGILS